MALLAGVQKSVTRQRTNYPQVLEFANESRKNGEFVDVTVIVGTTNIPANKVILSCYSEFFRRMFLAQMKEHYEHTVNITADVDANSVKSLLDFIYSGKIIINNENVVQLLKAADYLQLDEPKQFCIEFLDSNLSPANCFAILGVANFYGIEALQERVYKIMSTRFNEFITTDDFKSFTKDDVVSCIKKLDRQQTKEVTIYQAIVNWTKNDELKRKTEFAGLLRLVNFSNLTNKFLKDNVLTERLIKDDLASANLIMEAFRKHLDSREITEKESKILSFGGLHSLTGVTEVFNCKGKPKSVYSDLPIRLLGGAVLKLHDYVYCIGGTYLKKQVARMEVGEKFSDVKNVAPIINRRYSNFSAAVYSECLVVSGGGITCTECYTPQLNTWKKIAPTNQSKNSNVLVCCRDSLYDIGGLNENNTLSCVERLRGLEEQWEYVQPMQTGRSFHAAVSCNGYIYVMGGNGGRQLPNNDTFSSVEMYDPSLDSWMYVKEMNFPRYGHSACVIQSKIYVVGGDLNKSTYMNFAKDIESYDPESDNWNIVNQMNEGLVHHKLIVL